VAEELTFLLSIVSNISHVLKVSILLDTALLNTRYGSVKYPVQLGYVLHVAWLRTKYSAVKYQIRFTALSDTAMLSNRMLPCVCWSVITGILPRQFPPCINILNLFSHTLVCLTTGPQPVPKRVLHTVRSSASSLDFRYPLFSLRSSSSCLRLLPSLSVTCILPSTFLSITVPEGSPYAIWNQSS
jgi:hypothetical protein